MILRPVKAGVSRCCYWAEITKLIWTKPRHYLVRDWKKPMRNGCVPIRDLPLVACLRLVT